MIENAKNGHICESLLQIFIELSVLLNWKTNENFVWHFTRNKTTFLSTFDCLPAEVKKW